MSDYVLYFIAAVAMALPRVAYQVRARLDHRDDVRLLQHLADTRGTKAAIEMAQARRPEPRTRRILRLPGRRGDDEAAA